MAAKTVRVKGLRELQNGFRSLSGGFDKQINGELKRAVEPVRADAARRAEERISHIGGRWSQMRIGSTRKAIYVAPARRRHGGSPRPNLAGLLLQEAMLPALDANEERVIDSVDRLLGRLAGENF